MSVACASSKKGIDVCSASERIRQKKTFQTQKKSTELLILITPYVILSEQEAIQVGTDQLLKHPGAATAGALDHIEMEFDL